ncbi:MAG TPA: VOC family protein [Steroidobacteraceae bacterium]|nr:VOC family protein [Steroidobacteraceae bacterium]
MAKLIHSMIRVIDLDRTIAFYERGFGLEESHRMDFPTFTLVYLRDPESGQEIELTLNKGQTEPYTHGSGYGHVAFCVENLHEHQARMKSLGYPAGDIKQLSAPTGAARFYFTTDPDGYKIEVIERGGHYV